MSNPGMGRARGRGRARGESSGQQEQQQPRQGGGRARGGPRPGSGPRPEPAPAPRPEPASSEPSFFNRPMANNPGPSRPNQWAQRSAAAAGRAVQQPAAAAGRAVQPPAAAAANQVAPCANGEGRHAPVSNPVDNGDNTAITGRGGVRPARPKPVSVNTRPEKFNNVKRGSDGIPVKLVCNYFKLMTRPNWTLYQYRVDISPEEDRTAVRKTLLKDHRKKLDGYIFDGTVMYTPNKLNSDPMTLCSKRAEDDAVMTITLKLVGDVTSGDYVYIQIFNILMRKCYSSLKLQLLGRDFYDKNAKIDIKEHNLQIWPGYKTTIAQHENSILMVAEITHKVVRTDSVYQSLLACQEHNYDSYKKDFASEIVGQIVLTDYNNKTYRVTDVDWTLNPESTFAYNGDDITYIEYYKRKYNLKIVDRSQPLLISLAKERDRRRDSTDAIYLVPELCRMTGLDDKMRADFRLMKSLSIHTRVGPEARIQKLLAFNKRLLTAEECKADLKEWDMKLDNKLVEINGRQMPEETIFQGDGRHRYSAGETNEGWTKQLRNKPFVSFGKVVEWAVTTIPRLRRDTDNFVRMVIQAAAGMGLKLPPPTVYEFRADSLAIYVPELEKILSLKQISFVFCVVSSNKSDLYSAIKKKCCVDRAVPSQIVVARTLIHKSAMSIATKIAIQINCKLGGSPWTTLQPVKNLMVIGYDVCHDPKNKNRSYGAMVASINQNITKYYNCVTQHTNGEELASEFCINIKNALNKYKAANGFLPNVIIIYRDGVGEGQIPYVYQHEVEVIKKALEEMYGGPSYKLQFVIVSKRLNTRFFLNNSSNPKPGTVIDDVVTNPTRYDFFLVSQAVRDGTVAPTSYNVISDNTHLSPDHTQRMAYKFCHLYYNFSGQVRVPAPCQYAHKLAFLSSQNLGHTPNVNLSEVLFFL